MKSLDVVIIGSGLAALQLAQKLRSDLHVIIITKSDVRRSNSYLAQGGIAASLSKEDDWALHLQDTLDAGCYHNEEQVVASLTKEAPDLIHELNAQGFPFDENTNGQLSLGLEGAHSKKRIVHSGGDATGKHLIDFMINQLPKHVEVITDAFVYELLVKSKICYGVKIKKEDQNHIIFAKHVVLATGGCGQLFQYTSNSSVVTGDGLALAHRAGAILTDLEFIQFHPTLLFVDGEAKGLISEAVRGEGGVLVDEQGYPIMKGIHPLEDLAPRHIVAQTIYKTMKQGKKVYVNIQQVAQFSTRFPTISKLCEANGIHLEDQLIPVSPGAHFLMGGVKTNDAGETCIAHLYAIGEVARTGVHGANRLASNSLLEGLYFGKKVAQQINMSKNISVERSNFRFEMKKENIQERLPAKEDIQTRMMEYVGIVRNKTNLQKQLRYLDHYHLPQSLDSLSQEEIEIVFMMEISRCMTKSALIRTESRGGHFREDFPIEVDEWLKKEIKHEKKGEHDEYSETSQAIRALLH
ncbi:L-aspartate oxidase [Cytobacillus sp. FSL K6-0265]|uniref:L-aspartate oxidase n=1 Tax=Cytobacillus sp. FSL K6-0265 TaxID=2921448 RepID=UPI0030FB1FB5